MSPGDHQTKPKCSKPNAPALSLIFALNQQNSLCCRSEFLRIFYGGNLFSCVLFARDFRDLQALILALKIETKRGIKNALKIETSFAS